MARLDPDRYTGLTRIGVDECSYRKRHHYLTVVLNHDTGKVVWAAKGKNSEALCTFFDLIGPEQCASIHTVTIDMSAAYEKAVRERLPPATILFDRFHVQQLSTDAVEAVRRRSPSGLPPPPAPRPRPSPRLFACDSSIKPSPPPH